MKVSEAPKKIYVHEASAPELTEKLPYHIEYTRTEAFIEKACAWLSNMSLEDMEYKYDNFDTSEGWYKMIEEFRKYMKGE